MRPRYRHHQDSVVSSTETYDDFVTDASNAKPVASQQTVNGQVVSTVRGGCYTTPFYKYTIHHDQVNHPHNFVTFTGNDGGVRERCTHCGMVIGAGTSGSWGGTCYTDPAYDSTHYGTSVASGGSVQATYYLKTCGHTNGEVLSVHKRAYIATS
jgi:hypothetical protein